MYSVYIDGNKEPIYHDVVSLDRLDEMLESVKNFAVVNPSMDRDIQVYDGDEVVYFGPVSNWTPNTITAAHYETV